MSASAIIGLTRRVTFSSGHRYWKNELGLEGNRALFGSWASPYNHGHNYVLEATVRGKIEASTGMVVNIKLVDDLLEREIVSRLDGKSLNDEVPFFADAMPSVENILACCSQTLNQAGGLPSDVELTGLRLVETEDLYGEMSKESGWQPSLTRTYEFAAAHRLHVKALSPAENEALFGKCNNPAGHGHNFVLEVTVQGAPDPTTGMICDIAEIDRVVASEVVDRYDHKHLNVDIPEFQDRVVTSEILAQEIFSRLEGALPARLTRVRLYETARSWFEVAAAD